MKFKVFNLFVSRKTYDAKVAELEAAQEESDNAAYASWNKVLNERDFYVSEFKALDVRFKKAITDLAAARDEVKSLTAEKEHLEALDYGNCVVVDDKSNQIESLRAEIATLRPDALKHRARLERDRNRTRPSRAKSADKGKKS